MNLRIVRFYLLILIVLDVEWIWVGEVNLWEPWRVLVLELMTHSVRFEFLPLIWEHAFWMLTIYHLRGYRHFSLVRVSHLLRTWVVFFFFFNCLLLLHIDWRLLLDVCLLWFADHLEDLNCFNDGLNLISRERPRDVFLCASSTERLLLFKPRLLNLLSYLDRIHNFQIINWIFEVTNVPNGSRSS